MRKKRRSPLDGLPAWVLSVIVHLSILLVCAFIVIAQRVEPSPSNTFQVSIRPRPIALPPMHPPKQEELPVGSDEGPVAQGGPEAPLFLDAPVGDHNETDNGSDAGTICLADSIGVGSGGGPHGAGGRRYLRTAEGRRGASTTRAVDTGLDWLARHQSREGDWGRHTDRCAKGDASCANIAGEGGRRTSITALALLAILANGETPAKGPRAETLKRGLAWLAAHQSRAGQFESSYASDEPYSLYEQSIATWAMTEAAASTGEAKWRDCATRGVQNLNHRFTLRADTSVMGFIVMALKSAERAGIAVPERARTWGSKYFQPLAEKRGAFAYRLGDDNGSRSLSDVGVYACLLCGLPQANKAVKKCVDEALREGPPPERAWDPDPYHLYYWTLAYMLEGGETWEKWNAAVRELLTRSQVASGCARGSWEPKDEWTSNRVLSTALSILALHVCDKRLLLHREDSASAADERVTKESMAYGELLHEEALRACAVRGGTKEALAAVQAFLDWTAKADAKTEEDRRAIAEWTQEATEAAANVAVQGGDLEGALARLSASAHPSPSALVLRGLVRVERLPSLAAPKAVEAERRAAVQDLAAGLQGAPSATPSPYRLLAYVVKDLPATPLVDAPEGSLVRLAVEQGELARGLREALKAKAASPSLAAHLAAAKKTVADARLRDAAHAELLEGWEKETWLSQARLALAVGHAADAEEEGLALARDLRMHACDEDVVELLGAAGLTEATRLWNAGRRAEARPHAEVGASAYALVSSRDRGMARQLRVPLADLFYMAGEYEEAASRYQAALSERPDSASIQDRLKAALEATRRRTTRK